MKILVVDDSAIIRRTIVKVVTELRMESIEAENGAEALTMLRKHSRDISMVVLDWNMPVMDGFQALTKIRVNSDFELIPILMATADGVEEDVRQAIEAGANGYLIKPFNKDELADRISKLVPSTSSQSQNS